MHFKWIETMKANKGKSTACLHGDNLVRLEEFAIKNECKNISEVIIKLMDAQAENSSEEIENLKKGLQTANEAIFELREKNSELLKEIESKTLKSKADETIEFHLRKQILDFEDGTKKLQEQNEETISLLRLAQDKINKDSETISAFKSWLAAERNRISSWWHQAPPL